MTAEPRADGDVGGGLAAVLERHEMLGYDALFNAVLCTCGWESANVGTEGAMEAEHLAHAAAQVTAWIAEQLAAPELREAVRQRIRDRLMGEGIPDAALAAITAHLTREA